MITFFDDQDLISFGTYVRSELRTKMIEEDPVFEGMSEEQVQRVKDNITKYDIYKWVEIKQKNEQETRVKLNELDNQINTENNELSE